MGSAASSSAAAGAAQQKAQDDTPKPKQFLDFDDKQQKSTSQPKPAGAWGSNSPDKAKVKENGTRLFNTALSTRKVLADDDDDDFEIQHTTAKSPKRKLDTTAASPTRLAQRRSPKKSLTKRNTNRAPNPDSDVDADVADAVAMAEAAEARRKARRKQEKRDRKRREEREAHAREEAARFAAEERARAEEYKKVKADHDEKWNAITSPAGSPKASISPSLAAKATSPRTKRRLNAEAIKNRVSRKNLFDEEDQIKAQASGDSNEPTANGNDAAGNVDNGTDGGPGHTRRSSSNNNDDEANAASLADELLQETSAFGTHTKSYRPPSGAALPSYSKFDNEKFRKAAGVTTDTSDDRSEAYDRSTRRLSGFVGLGRLTGTGPAANRGAGRGGGGAAATGPNVDDSDEADDEDFMDQILNDADP